MTGRWGTFVVAFESGPWFCQACKVQNSGISGLGGKERLGVVWDVVWKGKEGLGWYGRGRRGEKARLSVVWNVVCKGEKAWGGMDRWGGGKEWLTTVWRKV